MAFLRGKLRLFATTWLVFQAACLSALVPRECCAAHRVSEKRCHESAPAARCPMRAVDGTACPMHRTADASEHSHHAPSAPADCRLTGICAGPMAALFTLLSNHGVLPESSTALPGAALRSVAIVIHDDVIGRYQPPESPPPRA